MDLWESGLPPTVTRSRYRDRVAPNIRMGKLSNHSACDFSWGECFDDTAFGDGAVSALTYEHVELPLERDKVGDFALDLAQMLAGDDVHRFAGAIAIVREPEELADLLGRKTKTACTADKA